MNNKFTGSYISRRLKEIDYNAQRREARRARWFIVICIVAILALLLTECSPKINTHGYNEKVGR